MGVNKLESYTKKSVPGGVRYVKIPQEVEKYRQRHPNDPRPLIVIDAKAFHQWILNSEKRNIMFGGQSQNAEKKLRDFFSKMHALGVRIVCFIDGPPLNLSKWCRKHTSKMKAQHGFLKKIENNLIDVDGKRCPVYYFSSFERILVRIAREYGELFFSVKLDNDSSLARYATQHDALAVMAKDTDFLIFKGEWKYWSVVDLKIGTMRTMEFSRTNLRRHLKLSENNMPLFASLAGNDIIDLDQLNSFHRRITSRRGQFELNDVAEYVNALPSKDESRISQDVTKKQDTTFIENLELSIDFYNIEKNYAFPDEPLPKKLLMLLDDCTVYCLHEGIPTEWYTLCLDMADPAIPSFAKLVEKILTKVMGIVLFDKFLGRQYEPQKFLCKPSESEPFQLLEIQPVRPEIDPPPLETLLFDETDKKLNETRFKLLTWMISPNITAEQLEKIEPGWLTISLAVLLLKESDFISEHEADIALICEDHLSKGKVAWNCPLPSTLTKRDFMISFLLPIAQKLINRAMDSCGLGKYAKLSHDGVYYHSMMQAWERRSAKEQKNLLAEVDKFRFYSQS